MGQWAHFYFGNVVCGCGRMGRQVQQTLYDMLEPVVNVLGCELVGIEYIQQGRHSILRLYIDKDTGVTVDDCSDVSYQVSGLLDVEDPIKEPYTLEVSSPGLDRLLCKAEHFERFAGHRARIRLRLPQQGRRNFTGVIKSCHNGQVLMDVDGELYALPVDAIEKARLVPEFD